MEYKVFLKFFKFMEKEKEITMGDYKIKYTFTPSPYPTAKEEQSIHYIYKDYELATDSIKEWYELGDIMPTQEDTYNQGIKDFDTIQAYLDYIYRKNIDKVKKERQAYLEQLQEIERQRLEKEQKEKETNRKLNLFLGKR